MINVIGKPKHTTKLKVAAAAEWLAYRLMGKRLAGVVTVDVVMVQGHLKDTGDMGTTFWEDKPSYSREFSLHLDRDMSAKSIMTTLAHEMVHVKQYAKGELKCLLRCSSLHRWKGVLVDDRTIDYDKHPWEVEAYALEGKLIEEYMRHEAQRCQA